MTSSEKAREIELLPCPFCGGEATLTIPSELVRANYDNVCVVCDECEIHGLSILVDLSERVGGRFPDEESEAIAAWNTRAALSPDPVAGEALEQRGGWTIWHQPWPIECRDYDWHFAHKNIRVAKELSGHAESREMCLQTIDWLEEQERERETEEGKAQTAEFVDAGMRTLNRALLANALKSILDLPGIQNLPGFATGMHLNSARYALDQYEDQTNG